MCNELKNQFYILPFVLGKDCEKNITDCPGSCNMMYTAGTVDKIDECECICMAGYTGINCTVNTFEKYRYI